MPDHDGTGPKGRGPLTGRCKGYCLLKIPRNSHEPLIGFVGRLGQPKQIFLREMGGEMESLYADLLTIETPIRNDEVRAAGQDATPHEMENAGS